MNIIKKLRTEKEWSQQHCCNVAGRLLGRKIFQQAWSRWEKAANMRQLHYSSLQAVAAAFGLTAESLIQQGDSDEQVGELRIIDPETK